MSTAQLSLELSDRASTKLSEEGSTYGARLNIEVDKGYCNHHDGNADLHCYRVWRSEQGFESRMTDNFCRQNGTSAGIWGRGTVATGR